MRAPLSGDMTLNLTNGKFQMQMFALLLMFLMPAPPFLLFFSQLWPTNQVTVSGRVHDWP
jgi:hypothetical protein